MELFRPFTDMKMRSKLIVSYLLVGLTPVFLIAYYLINSMTEAHVENTLRIYRNTLEQTRTNVLHELEGYFKLSNSIVLDKNLMTYLEKEYTGLATSEEEFLSYMTLYSNLIEEYTQRLVALNSELRIEIYTDNSTMIADNDFLNMITPDIELQGWYTSFMAAGGENVIIGPHWNLLKEQPEFYVGRNLISPTNDKYTNVLRLTIPESNLYRFIKGESEGKQIYLLDDHGIIVSATGNRKYIGQELQKIPGMAELLDSESRRHEIMEIPVNGYKISGWSIVSIIPMDRITSETGSIVRRSMLICAASVLCSLLLMLLFSNTLTRRLKLLVRNMGNIRSGKFDVFVNFEERDEIGDLYRSFRSMVERINRLIHEVYQAELDKKQMEIGKTQAELRALHSQINPHFLFNTMEAIRMSLVKKGETDIAEIVGSFAKLFRSSIDWNSDMVPVAKEMDFIAHYVMILQFRFRGRIAFHVEMDPELAQASLPKFSVQPLVENSISHGIERKADGGSIHIRVCRDGGDMVIEVRDDGVGMQPERLEEVRASLSDLQALEKRENIGVANVHRRLVSLYGEAYGLRIDSASGAGTCVALRLPLRPDLSQEEPR